MTYGAYFKTADGSEFVTPETTTIALDKKVEVSGNQRFTHIDVDVSTEDVIIPFAYTTGGPACLGYQFLSPTRIRIVAEQQVISIVPITLHAYIFTTKAQVPPKWGVAVWDGNGKCILTNETKILTDMITVGTYGNNQNNGIKLNTTLNGKFAVMPQQCGILAASSPIGTFSKAVNIVCYYNGSTSHVYAMASEGPPSGWPVTGTDYRTVGNAINAAYYD